MEAPPRSGGRGPAAAVWFSRDVGMIAPSSQSSSTRAGFLAAVRASGLLSDEQFQDAVERLSADARTDRAAAAAALIAAGLLTQFQAERLLSGRSGGFVL